MQYDRPNVKHFLRSRPHSLARLSMSTQLACKTFQSCFWLSLHFNQTRFKTLKGKKGRNREEESLESEKEGRKRRLSSLLKNLLNFQLIGFSYLALLADQRPQQLEVRDSVKERAYLVTRPDFKPGSVAAPLGYKKKLKNRYICLKMIRRSDCGRFVPQITNVTILSLQWNMELLG